MEFDFSSIPIIFEDTAQPLQLNHGLDFVEVPDSVIVEDPLNDVKEEKTLTKSIPSPIDSGGLDNNSASPKVQNQSAKVCDYKSQFDCRICQLPFSSKQGYNSHISKVHIKTQYLGKMNPASDIKQMFMDAVEFTLNRKEQAKEIKHATKKFIDKANNSIQQGKENIGNEYIAANPDGTFRCTVCNSVFKQSGNVARHFQTVHEKLKPFECAVCKRYFSSKQILMRHHVHVHEGKQRKCNACNRCFSAKHALRTHYAEAHEGKKKRYQCNLCSRICSNKQDLTNHVKKKHVYETACDSNITNHRKELNSFIQGLNETYLCEPCNRIFINEEKFMEHAKIIHKENHEKIDIQGVSHLSVHEEENPVLCDLCNIIFSSQEQFRTHFETMHEPKSTEDNNIEFAPSQQIK